MREYRLDTFLFFVDKKEYYRDGDLMITLFPEGTKKSLVMLEAVNTARAEELGIPVPPVIEVALLGSRWALVSNYVGGKLLSDLTASCGWEESVLKRFVELQINVHSKKSNDFPKLTDLLQRKISEVMLDTAVRYKLHTALDELPKHNKLCHGNFLPNRVIVGDNGEFYLVDWLFASQGNCACDASYTYLTLLLDRGTELAERYITSFSRKNDTPRQDVERFIKVVAAIMLKERGDEGKNILMNYIKW